MRFSNYPTVPDPPVIDVVSTTATSIRLSGGVPSDSVADSYEVMWQRNTSVGCPDEDEGSITITDDSISYDIMGLEEDSSYIITVTAYSLHGSCDASVSAMILQAGEILH